MSGERLTSVIFSLWKYVAVFLSVAICVVAALTSSIYVPTFHLDGAFQTASGLFRLESGQLPGRDFYPYLGVGPLLVIFPTYKIFGGDLAATVAAAKFITIFLSWIAVATIWNFVFRPAKFIYALVGGSLILFGVNFIASQSSLPNLLAFGLEPGNSLRPVRAVLPYLVALSIYFLIKSIVHVNARNLLISTTLGAALLWSNDFAIPTFGLFLLFVFLYLYCFDGNWIRNASIIAATSIIVWFVLLSLVTAGHSFDLLKYNFFDVRKDQWWYFGPYGSNTRIFEISQLPRLFSAENYFPLLVLFVALLVAIKTRFIEYYLVFSIGLTLFAGGSLASIGGHLGGYFGGFYFWGVATSIIFFLKVLTLVATSSKWLAFYRRPSYLHIPSLLMIGLMVCMVFQDYKGQLNQVQTDPDKFYVDDFGAYLDVGFREYIEYAHQNRALIAIEDYWGLWNSLNKSFPPWPVDSVIHALGTVREISQDSLRNADLIITTRYSTSPTWQPWNLSQNYWFYDELISKWEPVLTSPTTMVWKRAHDRSTFLGVACHVSADKSSFTLPQSVPGFYRITLGYSSVGGGRHLLMVRNNISYGADAGGFLSLMPGTHIATFPVLLSPEEIDVFNLKVIGEAHAEISSCTADRVVYENDELLRVRQPSDFFLTDGNWINGIARRWAGFFTHNTEVNRANFKVGNTVVFSNGDKRAVVSVAENGPYLNIWVDGEILRSEDVGLPSKYKVLQ